eukprot:scaffold59027_cov19-Tisochrysis_lutea.AAC.1
MQRCLGSKIHINVPAIMQCHVPLQSGVCNIALASTIMKTTQQPVFALCIARKVAIDGRATKASDVFSFGVVM